MCLLPFIYADERIEQIHRICIQKIHHRSVSG